MGGVLCGGAGPPTPLMGAVSPAGADRPPALIGKVPRLTGILLPGPPALASICFLSLTGGASGKIDIIFSPRSSTKPNIRLISLSLSSLLGLIVRNSSQSARTTFICLSKAMKVPTMTRVS